MSTPNLFQITDTFNDTLSVGRMGHWAIIAVEIGGTEDDPDTHAAGICLDRQQRLQVAEILTPHGALLEGRRQVEDPFGNVLVVQIERDEVIFDLRPKVQERGLYYTVELTRSDALHAYELLTR